MDRELIAKRLAFIETCLRELRTNARLDFIVAARGWLQPRANE